MEPIAREFYDRDPVVVAQELLGKLLLRRTDDGLAGGRVVETEAYLSEDDPACHAARGQTRRNASMFGPPGHAYVYSIHAKWCFNVVTEPCDTPSAVLIRAIEPLFGIPLMQQRRGKEPLLELTRGPARLCQSLAIDKTLDGWDLTRGETLWLTAEGAPPTEEPIAVSPRIGVTSAHEHPLRFFYAGNRFVSGRKFRDWGAGTGG